MKSLTPVVAFSLYPSCLCLIFAYSLFFTLCFCNHENYSDNKVECIPTERLALIEFKNSLVDPANCRSSWSGEDCCSWSGVICDNFSHHVHEIHLRGPEDGIHGHCHGSYDTDDEIEETKNQMLGGMITPCLITLQQLRYLDLSCNDFRLTPIPSFIDSLQNLRYLNISNSQFTDEIPHQLGNITSLLVLDLHHDYVFSNLRSENLKWIANLKQLQYLDVSGIYLTGASDWLQLIKTLSSLQELRLSNCGLTQIPSFSTSLLVLDLSHNHFSGHLLPGWVLSLNKLTTLDLTSCHIRGLNLGSTQGGFDSMPSLTTFCLSRNTFVNTSFNLNVLSNLSNLRHLDVSDCDISGPILVKLQNPTLIDHLDLSGNRIVEEIPKSLNNLCNLTTLNLGHNNFYYGDVIGHNDFYGDVTELLERFCECESRKLKSLDLSFNSLTGQLPEKLGRLENLATIDMAYNMFTGILPHSVGDLSSLEYLDLSHNRLNGSLPESIGKLGKLIDLRLDNNFLTGIVTENHFVNLTTLEYLWARDNNLVFDIVNNWIPHFQLVDLVIGSCNLGPLFPSWVQSQTNLEQLDLGNANISDTIPNWFWSTFSSVRYALNISHNNIPGKLGDVSNFSNPQVVLDLSFNRLYGELPCSFSKPDFDSLDISSNNLSGSLDQFLCYGIQKPRHLLFLNLANNNISCGLPNCWMNWKNLRILNLENNRLSGKIPSSLGNISSLVSLDIRNNKLSGEIPMSLFNSKSLLIVSLAENGLTGRIPTSIGGNETVLKILSLHSNKLSDEIPNELCRLSLIQILDLAHNNLSGCLPKCFTNFTFFSGKFTSSPIDLFISGFHDRVSASATLVTKGQFHSYRSILNLVTTLDLSDNNFSGSIPNELVSLPGLRFLNLSHNKLTGRIPNTFIEMKELESLDLSVNHLVNHLAGEIPLSLAGLTLLDSFNVSYNNITGRISTGHQFQTFNESVFIGNALCGAPLKACQEIGNNINGTNGDDDDEKADGIDWILVICMIVGFAVGFWVTIGSLIVSKQWRYAYYLSLDELWNKLSNFIFLVSMLFRWGTN